MLSFHHAVEDDFQAVNELIIEQLHSRVPLVENIGHYIVDAGGKRLRPLLVLLLARALNYGDKRHIDLAASIEFIHTATLLHDDVVDLSALRRNRPTANAQWGNAPSVLVGDFLYSRAFQILVDIGNMNIMKIISEATNLIAEGEVLQLVNAGNPETDEQNYLQVIHYKTAQLFEAATESAAVMATVTPPLQEACRLYGHHLGMAFQLVDDMLDYCGNSESMGKNIGDDLAEGKPTLPLIHALLQVSEEEQALIRNAISNKDSSDIDKIIQTVKNSGALDYTKQQAQQHVEKAIVAIDPLDDTKYKQALLELARFSLSRTN